MWIILQTILACNKLKNYVNGTFTIYFISTDITFENKNNEIVLNLEFNSGKCTKHELQSF